MDRRVGESSLDIRWVLDTMRIDPGDIGEAISRDIQDEDGELGRKIRQATLAWATRSSRAVRARGDQYDYNTEPVAQQIRVSDEQWSASGRVGGEFLVDIEFGHPASSYFEHGTEDHVIEPVQATVLRVPWPDAPPGVVEKRGDSPYFFGSVEVSGLDALRFVEAGRLAAEYYLDNA